MYQKSNWTWQEIINFSDRQYYRGIYEGTLSAYISTRTLVRKELENKVPNKILKLIDSSINKEISELELWYNSIEK